MARFFKQRLIGLVFFGLIFTTSAPSQQAAGGNAKSALAPEQQLARDIYRELVEINTTDSAGDTTKAAEALAARFRSAGFPAADVQIVVNPANPQKGNLVVRYRAVNAAQKPILLLGHLDVVEAKKEDWSPDLDPFKLTERDGYYYGRGTSDDKAMSAILAANLLRFKQENAKFDRDLILALTADEENGDFNGVEYLLKNKRDLVDAEFGINEGGGGRYRKNVKLFNGVQASEKVFQSYTLEVKNKGGHSSLPSKDNAIYRLAAGLDRLSKFDFPVNLNEVTRGYFQKMSAIETGAPAADMKALVSGSVPDAQAASRLSASSDYYNALMRTTCVATRLTAGHAENALPQTAQSTINCRILPQENAADVQRKLVEVLADVNISVTPIKPPKPSPPSPLKRDVIGPIEQITNAMWKGVPVVPIMSSGATDGLYFRQAGIPIYGVSGIFSDIDDNRAHGRDERLAVQSFYDGQQFLYRLVKALAGGTDVSKAVK